MAKLGVQEGNSYPVVFHVPMDADRFARGILWHLQVTDGYAMQEGDLLRVYDGSNRTLCTVRAINLGSAPEYRVSVCNGRKITSGLLEDVRHELEGV